EQVSQMEARSGVQRERVATLMAEVARLGQAGREAATEAGVVDNLHAKATADLHASEQGRAHAEQALRQSEAEVYRWGARAEAQARSVEEARARSGAERLAGVAGVVGPLVDLVEVEPGWDMAFEAAAGEVLVSVVVDTEATARRSLEDLGRLQAKGTVVSLSAEAAGPGRTHLPAGAHRVGDHVRSAAPGVGELLQRLLARCVTVDGDWSQALDMALDHPDLVVVTRSGDRCAGGVWRLGDGGSAATAAAHDDARRHLEVASHAQVEAAEDARRARADASAAATTLVEARRALEANALRRQTLAEALQRAEQATADASAQLESLEAERGESGRRLIGHQAQVAELERALPALEAEGAARSAMLSAERADRSRLAEREAAVSALKRDLEVRAAGLEERRAILDQRLAEVEGRLARNVAARDQAAGRRQELGRNATALRRLGELVGRHLVTLEGTVARLRAARRAEAEAITSQIEQTDRLRRQRAGDERQLGEQRQRLSRAEVEEAEARVRLEALIEAIRRDLECEPDALRGAECPPLSPGTSPPSRRTQLDLELRLLGPINPLALDEHAALSERHQFLEAQLEDVRAARRELAKVIRAIDREMTDVLRAALGDVADNFGRLFATLFPGGDGRLRLTDPDHLLDTGIELEARPSGKSVRRLSLLSGGERSLTAMAFLFAVFRSRPSPFYLLDEVEAALDDVNLHRFL
ncbi:MAG: hypothetical protein ACRD0J_14455, partial [Acidimicrobiales bacterium]